MLLEFRSLCPFFRSRMGETILGGVTRKTEMALIFDYNPNFVYKQAVKQVQREAQEKYDAAVAAAATAAARGAKGKLPSSLPPRVVGVCVGQGEAMSMLEGVDGVVCVGWKAGEELATVVSSCDVMVAPSEVRDERRAVGRLYSGDKGWEAIPRVATSLFSAEGRIGMVVLSASCPCMHPG